MPSHMFMEISLSECPFPTNIARNWLNLWCGVHMRRALSNLVLRFVQSMMFIQIRWIAKCTRAHATLECLKPVWVRRWIFRPYLENGKLWIKMLTKLKLIISQFISIFQKKNFQNVLSRINLATIDAAMSKRALAHICRHCFHCIKLSIAVFFFVFLWAFIFRALLQLGLRLLWFGDVQPWSKNCRRRLCWFLSIRWAWRRAAWFSLYFLGRRRRRTRHRRASCPHRWGVL